MRYKSILTLSHIIIQLNILLMLFTTITYFINFRAFLCGLIVTVVAIVLSVIRLIFLKKNINSYFNNVIKSLKLTESDTSANFELPVLATHKSGEVAWYNESFKRNILKGKDILGETADFLFDENTDKDFEENRRAEITYNDRKYTVYDSQLNEEEKEPQKVYYFFDITKYKQIESKYIDSRLSVIYVLIDSLDVLLKNAKESEKAVIVGAIEKEIEAFASQANGFFQKLASDRYILIVEEKSVAKLKENKFQVLNKVRALNFGERGGTTLSIGIGRGETILDGVDQAAQALDMAQGRGGDQAVIKILDSFEFYGGVSQGVEKRSRVRTRVIASAMQKLIESSDNVLIMGHRFSDLDSFGSSYALWVAIKELGKSVNIILDKEKTLAAPLVERVEAKNEDMILNPDEAKQFVTKKTLLIIVDTHRAEFLENKEIYDMAKTIIVIDHHRKNVDFINNAVIFYHEPVASSTCELIAEMLQYMNPRFVGRFEAEALLSGIMLDTRNFVLRTGVRTFEASAFLRSRGADPVEVKKLFSGSMESYRERAEIVAAADIIDDCAISFTDEESPFMRVACAQAADELLSISGINASFVMFPTGNLINISARSMGSVNVQLVMELLGGGGHQTMAAAQLEGETIESAKEKLTAAILKTKERQ